MTLPNIITLARLLSVPVAIWLMLISEFQGAFWIFLLAGISDAVDGFIAKRFDLRSELGAFLDPIADKVLLTSVFVTLGVLRQIPAFVAILVVARDVMILGGYLLLRLLGQAPKVRPLFISKVNTVLQIILAALELLRLAYPMNLFGTLQILIWAVAASTVLSGAAYLIRWSREAGEPAPPL